MQLGNCMRCDAVACRGAIVYANAVTTVSPTYAGEVVSGGAAGWLRSTFARPELSSKFKGILNGIDTEEWDPAADPLLPANFDADQPEGKALLPSKCPEPAASIPFKN
ncbi:putative starch synthase 4, chloroplastic/amyloplastic [Tetrabaena socialis]|uniref:starch synthase n=1 Tax=Tetrabaena socialis TaxID=47790 RepID=A0A2J8AFU7_9CHLO|nr:putative starch synthase 4, chloroplastic/amyloplastic [Tetrabaena socialis]|eukprot:PNH11376.1 putative starch synthase 4, chloroplastic/amyloplastic [Tetrabaena socialis]